MRRPHICCDKHEEGSNRCPPQGSGALARVRRFLAISLGGRRSPGQAPSHEKQCLRPCAAIPSSPSPQMLTNLRAEADNVLGRPLDEVMRSEEKETPHGVPSFVHTLCCHMLTHGVDYDILVKDDWCSENVRSSLLEDMPERNSDLSISQEAMTEATVAAGLFRLFLQELPQPLLNKEAATALTRMRKEMDGSEGGKRDLQPWHDFARRARNVLYRKLPAHNLQLLQYLTAFLHQLRTANHNTCPVPPSALSRVLGRALTEEGRDLAVGGASAQRLAEMLLLNHALIFRDTVHIPQDPDYNSDSPSSTCDSKGNTTDEADLFTPDDDDADGAIIEELGADNGEIGEEEEDDDEEEDSTTTTTTDTDDFRSPPVSPLKRSPFNTMPSTSSERLQSTAELPGVEGFKGKITPFGKDYLPSITGLLSSPKGTWKDEVLRSSLDKYDHLFGQSAESSCVSGEEISELESEADRDADGSDTEGAPQQWLPCPHEERRTSERFLPRGHTPSGGRRPKRRTRKKHSKDSSSRVQSSEEEEKESPSSFSSLLSRDDEPTTFDPTPPDLDSSSQPFRDLLASSEPVPSDRTFWGLREESFSDNWQRTTHHYSREDDDKSIQPSSNWYRSEDREEDYPPSKYSDSTMCSSDEFSRSHGQSAIKLLTKHVNGIKRKIKKFEEEFERNFGYRPSHSDKMKHKDIKKHMAELSKAKKELKQMKEDVPEKRNRNTPKVYPISLLRCQESTSSVATSSSSSQPHSTEPASSVTAKETLRQVEDRLDSKRNDAKRPVELAVLTLEQLQDEKTDIQKALLFYESIHGRPSTREDRDLVRPLYDRYRQVKRAVIKLASRPKENIIELAPILEHEAMDFTLASPQHRGSLQDEDVQEDEVPIGSANVNPEPHPEILPIITTEINLADLHALPIHELKERKKIAREKKKRLRHALREYEEKFEGETGRKLQKEDRGPMEQTYTDYKHVKAKLRLLEALLSKYEQSRYE